MNLSRFGIKSQEKSFAICPGTGYRLLMTDQFKAWMDERKLSAEQVGERLHVSPQTVRNWRAAEIPPRRQEQIRNLMSQWDDGQIDRIVLTPRPEQFDDWNRAANREGKTIREWVTTSLDTLAAEQFPVRQAVRYPSAADERHNLRSVLNEEPPRTGTEAK